MTVLISAKKQELKTCRFAWGPCAVPRRLDRWSLEGTVWGRKVNAGPSLPGLPLAPPSYLQQPFFQAKQNQGLLGT